jgi:drug/metabolite transporter (DMT)-like permease
MALTGVVAFAPILYQGLRLTTAVNATLITGSGPLITGALAAALIQEPMTRRQTVAAVAGLVGVTILITGERSVGWQLQINPGDLVILGATTLWGLYTVLSRRATRYYSALTATAYSSFLGLFFLIPAAGWETRTLAPEIEPTVSLAVLYIGLVPTVLGFVSWNEGIRRLGPGGASIFYNTLPLFGAVLGFVFLNEPIGLYHLIGGSLIIGSGLWAAQRRQ